MRQVEIAARAMAQLSPYDQARIDKWIRDQLIDWRNSCWRCRKPINVGQGWLPVSNGQVTTRFHAACHLEWLAEQEVAACRALGLPDIKQGSTKETTTP